MSGLTSSAATERSEGVSSARERRLSGHRFRPITARAERAQSNTVNTFIGTRSEGNTFPGAALPFGMAQSSPIGSHYAESHYEIIPGRLDGTGTGPAMVETRSPAPRR